MTRQQDDLDTLFALARSADPAPSAALQARVLSDAAALQPVARARVAVPLARIGWLDRIAALFGGGPALAGLGFAALAGLFLGLAQPAPVALLTVALLANPAGAVDLFPASDALWEE